ncbi:hypothetical protein RB195_019355 [Necator americanus]|uniref:Uncharacterized protein n=1 Tax=Necator americanus TaxID=51031 RepID=A0ABR1CFE3_NECAM
MHQVCSSESEGRETRLALMQFQTIDTAVAAEPLTDCAAPVPIKMHSYEMPNGQEYGRARSLGLTSSVVAKGVSPSRQILPQNLPAVKNMVPFIFSRMLCCVVEIVKHRGLITCFRSRRSNF